MSDEFINPELWDFPTTIEFKTMALQRPDIEYEILAVIQKVIPGEYSPKLTPSRKGNYVSVTVPVRFENAEQVEQIYREVRELNDVRLCL